MQRTLAHTTRFILTFLFLLAVVAGNVPLWSGRVDGPYAFSLAWTLTVIGGLGSLGMFVSSRLSKPLLGYFATALLSVVALPLLSIVLFGVAQMLGYRVKTVAAVPPLSQNVPLAIQPDFTELRPPLKAFPDIRPTVPELPTEQPVFSEPRQQAPPESAVSVSFEIDPDTITTTTSARISPPSDSGPPVYAPEPDQPGAPTQLVGSALGFQFQTFDLRRRAMIGFRYLLQQGGGEQTLAVLVPLFQRSDRADGTELFQAREGYAIGGLQIAAGEAVHAIRVKCMRQLLDGSLDKADSYLSEWIGDPRGRQPIEIGDGESRVIGICGRQGGEINALGLIVDRSPPESMPARDPATVARNDVRKAKPDSGTLEPPVYVEPPNQPGTPTQLVGGPEGWQFDTFDQQGRAVVGFQHAMGSWDGIASIAHFEPLFEREGTGSQENVVMAREGYVVGGLQVVGGRFVNAVRVIFVRQDTNGLLQKGDNYLSDWIGDPGDEKPIPLGDGVRRVIGICGRHGGVKNAVALILADETPTTATVLAVVPKNDVPKPSRIANKRKMPANAPAYDPPPHLPGTPTELVGGPEGWQFEQYDVGRRMVIGFRHSMGGWDGIPSVAEFDPIYEGSALDLPANSLLAREGYVVGRLHVVGDRFVNAIRVEFVRKKRDGSLDARDNYLSDWIGEPGGKRPTIIGDGKTPVLGVCGRNGAIKNAIALILDLR